MDLILEEKIILENDRVRLEPLSMDHYDLLLPIALDNPNLLLYSPALINEAEQLSSYISQAINNSNNRYPFLIFDKKIGQVAGSTSYGNIANKDQRLEIGWTWIGRSFQRTGLNRHCKFLLLTYAFETLGFKRVEFKTDARNVQSRKAIEGIGGLYEGKLRSHSLMSDGHRRDTVYYSILNSEWEGVKKTIFKSF